MYTSPLWPDLTHTSLAVPIPHGPSLNVCTPSLRFTKCAVAPVARLNTCSNANTPLLTPGQSTYRYIVLGCGSFVRGRKRKKGDSIPFILSRRDYMSRLHDECPKRASTASDKLSSIPIIYIPNPFSTWQSRNADPVKQREPSIPNS